MMVSRISPVGIDVPIIQLQTYLYEGLSFGNWESHDRAYTTEAENGLRAEIYTRKGEYEEIFFNDTFDCTSFFIVNPIVDYNEPSYLASQEASLIFQVKLNKVFPNVAHRADEEFRNAIIERLKTYPAGLILNSTETGIRNVYREFEQGRIKYTDMSDFHVLRLNFDINYDSTCCEEC